MTAVITETPGYTILGIYCVFYFSTELSKEQKEIYSYVNHVAVTVNSQAGQNPVSDAAVTLARVAGGNLMPGQSLMPAGNLISKVMYECKPTVHPHLEFVSDHE